MLLRSKLTKDGYISIRFLNHYTPQLLFSDENKRECIKKLQSLLPRKVKSESNKSAAVLIPLCIHNDQVSLLYQLRAGHMANHRGQVSFPGGMRDTNDKTFEETALRETWEELGIPHEDFEIWGHGNLMINRSNISIMPVVGSLKKELIIGNLVTNHDEVNEAFTIPIQTLANPNYHAYTQFRNAYSMPVYLGGQHKVWGLTAIITHLFLKALLPLGVYKHSVTYIPSAITNR